LAWCSITSILSVTTKTFPQAGLYRLRLSQAKFDDSGRRGPHSGHCILPCWNCEESLHRRLGGLSPCGRSDLSLPYREGRAGHVHCQKLLADQSLLINERRLSMSLLGEAEARLQGFGS
jgi:hypothetical protein